MTFVLGLAFLILGGFALVMMNVTNTIPFRMPWGGAWQKEEDPSGFRGYLIAYRVMAGLGALLLLADYVAGL